MFRVVGVHGIFQEQLGAETLLKDWRPALVDGLDAADRQRVLEPDFAMAYYGGLFLSPDDHGRPVTKGAPPAGEISGLSWIDELQLDPGEEQFLTEAIGELPEVVSPEEVKARVPKAVRPLTRLLVRRVDGRLALMLVPVLRQVRLYLADDDLAARARAEVEEAIGDGCAVLVGHSLGSVVAQETLALRPDLDVDTLITLGSPLSMKTVVRRLRAGAGQNGWGLPGRVRRWVNVYDKGDPVAAAGPVRRLWPDVEDFTVFNGNSPHWVVPYLGKRVTGRAILDALPGPQPQQ